MQYFLAKTEPSTYSIDDLQKEKKTSWNGVRNPSAVLALKQMRKGDLVLIYHSGTEKAIVGLAIVLGNSRPDPNDPKSWLVDFGFKKKFGPPFVTLGKIKEQKEFANLPLVRQGRLSTMALPNSFIRWLKKSGLPL
jgi:predicted RNA-binding protein with PUA-like domain